MSEKNRRGHSTGVDLGDVRPLMTAPARCSDGYVRPRLTRQAMQLAEELSDDTYSMELLPWVQSGWRELTVQMERLLASGLDAAAEDRHTPEQLVSALRLKVLQEHLRHRDPLAEVAGVIRQRHEADSGRVLVMLHPAEAGHYVVAISFMGTSNHVYDWLANLRMTITDGFHTGFLQLARQFESR